MGELPPTLLLIARSRKRELGRFSFGRDTITVGSADENGFVIADGTVSRRHLEISTRGGALLVKDLESRNGTRYQGSKLREAFVPVGAVLVLGEVEVRIEAEEDPSASAQLGSLTSVAPPMMKALQALARVAKTDTTVLLEAETGCGKEVTARALHQHSARADKPFETVDCSSLARELAASELFGHVKGAFTGADRTTSGAFERAEGGTLFLDEVGELPLEQQPLLLRALESRQVRRIGDEKFRPVDVRVIAATNRELDAEVKAGRFRADLLHRLAVVRIRIPPLRERLADLPFLVRGILDGLGGRAHGFGLSQPVLEQLRAHQWPGNVRELKNLIERGVALGEVALPAPGAARSLDYHQAREGALAAFEREFIEHVLRSCDGNVSKAARESGIDRVYLHKLIKKHNLAP